MARTPKSSGIPQSVSRKREYGRKQGNRSEALIHICSEGEKTEPRYFKFLAAELRIHVETHGTCRNVDEALEKADEGDTVYWLFDTESPFSGVRVDNYLEQAASTGVQPVVSNPCFEYWLLLHFERSAGDFLSADKVMTALKNQVPYYRKDIDLRIYNCIREYRQRALDHAEDLRKSGPEHWGNHDSPSTDVDLLVRKLEEISRQHPWG